MNRSYFVVIEGLDWSGKSTLAREVAARLGAEALATPMRTLPAQVRQGAEAMCAGDSLARMLFYASTVAAASTFVRARLAEGCPVVMDRYWLSTLSYHLYMGAPAMLREVEATLTPPDLTVFLNVSRATRRQRLVDRGELLEHDRMTLQPGAGEAIAELYREYRGLQSVGRFLEIEADRLTVLALVDRVVAALGSS